jgi:hypothetical protein
LVAVGASEIYCRARVMYFTPDEIHNLDPIVTFLRTGDYTSRSQGNHPFDPVTSAGVLATLLNGVVFLLGGSLFAVRLMNGLAQLAAAIALATALLRRAGLQAVDAAVIGAAVWVAMVPVGSHELRIILGGELWAFLYLLAGLYLAGRSPWGAALVWGLGVWLVKLIYLPFAGALLLAQVLSDDRSRSLRGAAALAAWFLAPLFAWMAVIWIRHDFQTLLAWCFSFVAFVAKHSASVALNDLPTFPGWTFDPNWHNQAFLDGPWTYVRAYVIPLYIAGGALAAHTVLRFAGVVRPSRRETFFLLAVVAALAVTVGWFFALDPTQWGRHLMPSVYVAVALAVYCAADVWRRVPPRGRAVVGPVLYAGLLVGSFYTSRYALDYTEFWSWQASYSRTCRGGDVLSPPCSQNDAITLLTKWAGEICPGTRDPFHPGDHCMSDERTRFLARAVEVLEDPASPERGLHLPAPAVGRPELRRFFERLRAARVRQVRDRRLPALAGGRDRSIGRGEAVPQDPGRGQRLTKRAA